MRLFDFTIKALHCCIPESSREEEGGVLQISSKLCITQLHRRALRAFYSGKNGSGGWQELPFITEMVKSHSVCNKKRYKPLDMTRQNI